MLGETNEVPEMAGELHGQIDQLLRYARERQMKGALTWRWRCDMEEVGPPEALDYSRSDTSRHARH